MILAISSRWHKACVVVSRQARKVLRRAHNRLARTESTHVSTVNLQSPLAQLRYDACSKCPKLHPQLKMCGACGCFMPAKVQVTGAKCPDGKW